MNNLKQSIVLVGLMGSGKSSVGRRLAAALGVEFVDVDDEIIKASELTISEIFEQYGELEFRALETRVLKRLLSEKPRVIATGGGAFMREENRELISENAVSVWLDADLDTLYQRVRHKTHRPLLNQGDPKLILQDLLIKRNPYYKMAQYRVPSYANQSHDQMVERIAEVVGLLVNERPQTKI